MTEELVVLCDENDNELGTTPKKDVHGAQTPLHRAFSSFVFRENGDILLQQRSHVKKTWPLVWSNSCCGHPLPGESREHAVARRMDDELGMKVGESEVTFMSSYRYCFTRFGVMENEVCPLYVVYTKSKPVLNPEEVESIKWMKWKDYVQNTIEHPDIWSEWCVEEVKILDSLPGFNAWLENHNITKG